MRPEITPPTAECPNPEQWYCHDGMATEVEVIQFLAYLVRMLKSKVVIETGCYKGFATYELSHAVAAHGGIVHSCDIDAAMVTATHGRLAAGMEHFAQVHHCSGVELIRKLSSVDFAFLDSDFNGIREAELEAVLPKLMPSGVIAVHDTSRRHAGHGGPRNGMFDAAKRHGLEVISFDTPRGLMLLRKPL